MSKITDIRFAIVTDAGGDYDVTSGETFTGRLIALQYEDIDFDAGIDLTLSCVGSDVNRNLIVLTNADADKWHDVHGLGSDVAAASSAQFVHPFVAGALRCVVAAGGNAKTGTLICYVES